MLNFILLIVIWMAKHIIASGFLEISYAASF